MPMRLVLEVGGMRCGGCEGAVQAALLRAEGVASAEVSCEQGRATVHGEQLVARQLVAAVEATGKSCKVFVSAPSDAHSAGPLAPLLGAGSLQSTGPAGQGQETAAAGGVPRRYIVLLLVRQTGAAPSLPCQLQSRPVGRQAHRDKSARGGGARGRAVGGRGLSTRH